MAQYTVNHSGDGSNADAAFAEAFHLAHQLGGGTVFIPAGRYLLTQPIEITRTITVRGEGWAGGDDIIRGTILMPLGDLFRVNVRDPVIFSDFQVQGQVTGTFFRFDAPNGQTNAGSRIRHVWTNGGYCPVEMVNASIWGLQDCVINNAQAVSLWIRCVNFPDGGDQFVQNCSFSGSPSNSHVLYQSGGGLKFNDSKINGSYPVGIRLQLITGGQNTGDLLIGGNSIEGGDYAIMLYRNPGETAHFYYATITGNQMGGMNGGVVVLPDPNGVWLHTLAVTGNAIAVMNAGGAGIDLASVEGASAVGNSIRGPSGAVGVRVHPDANVVHGLNALSGGIA